MMRRLLQIAVGLFLLSHAATHSAQAQTGNKVPIKIIYSALTASNGPVWLAGDQGLYDKYGLDVQIVHGRGAFADSGTRPPARLNLVICGQLSLGLK